VAETAIIDVINKKGLHARAAAKFVKVASAYDASVCVAKVARPGEEELAAVGGTSILGLMMLGADCGSQLHITAEGEHAQPLLAAIAALMGNKFGEGE
jgi:phosphocarrier protein